MKYGSNRAKEIDSFLTNWLTETVTLQSLEEGTLSVFDLATACRIWGERGFTPYELERQLGPTVEEAIMVTVNGLRNK
ncbi:hypothetical protein [Mesorhizobium sp. B2-3-4]|uniref:hypothetical protein n=1 Tax=Mesorhizobium sp. B2-3-4 TaxID=2589959 RepID=UPI00112EDD60|nr:hypothetical protein [Mesorhizobium sp. B2-3-4]TPM30012.1 hypothetical protein FJ967_27455 [Mesorhizobium sp. B2-3-4]